MKQLTAQQIIALLEDNRGQVFPPLHLESGRDARSDGRSKALARGREKPLRATAKTPAPQASRKGESYSESGGVESG